MDANDFIEKLKADDTEKDICDLRKVFDEYKAILIKLPTKDRGLFSLNLLRILCRNLDKASSWRDRIDIRALLTLSIDCIRETRALDKADRVKALACVYHLHRHAVRLNKSIPPELVLKISFMPFELDSKYLLQEYCKTYWNILADRLSYIERLKTRVNIAKLLPKLTEDILKVIDIYDTVQFCSNILVFLIKKLHFLYNEFNAKDLSQTFGQIFTQMSTKEDLKSFKKLPESENLEIYTKLNECLYVIAENASKVHFKDCMLDGIVRTCISLVGHQPDLFHCLQTFYLNTFCSILSVNTNLTYTVTVLASLQQSFETTEKLGYKKAMQASYPFLNQFLRLYIEYNVTNCSTKAWQQHFNIQIQENCLKLIHFFMNKLKYCEQLLKCENCGLKTGLHDSLRLSFLIKHFATVSLSQNILITDILEIFLAITNEQYAILTELNKLGCVNYQKFFRKLQTDVHNTAISLNKAQYYEFSIKLFDIYLKHELKCVVTEHKNISRALFNKSICELDCKLYEKALIDAFLSLVFSQQEGLNTDKYMSLVMDIKAKELKSKCDIDDEELESDDIQLVSVLDGCKMALEKEMYGDLKRFMSELKFSALLKHEFSMYAKLWPSIAPIGGVWRSLFSLADGNQDDWMLIEQEDAILEILYEVILETPSAVRTVHSEYFTVIVDKLLEKFDNTTKLTTNLKIVQTVLLFLKCEYELAEASIKYKWKPTEPIQSMDPDEVPANRTIPQEHAATKQAIVAVQLLSNLLPSIHRASKTYLRPALQVYQVFVPLLLHLSRDVQALQLAYVCCRIADIVGDDEAYIRNAGTLLSASAPSAALDRVVARAGEKWGELAKGGSEVAIIFLCDAAVHYSSVGAEGAAARLVQRAQAHILTALQLHPDSNFDLAVGRVMEAQTSLCTETGPSALTAYNGTQRHYLSIGASGTKWASRRLQYNSTSLHTGRASARAAALPRALALRRRARGSAAAGLRAAGGAALAAALYVEVTRVSWQEDAQTKIDNRLKHFLGLQPSNETQPYYATPQSPTKTPQFTPKRELETMRDNMVLKKTQTSPSLPCVSVPAFKPPDFFKHSLKCTCYACEIPVCFTLACKTSGLEATMYSRSNENEIARNYFEGVFDMLDVAKGRLEKISKKYKEIYEHFIVDSVLKGYKSELLKTQLEFLVESSFLELRSRNFNLTDEYIVKIHEMLEDMGSVDPYLANDVTNLMVASAQMKKIIKKHDEFDLESEFESLKLSPGKDLEPPKTPVTKPLMPPKATKMLAKDEEIPKKRKVIKLNLDDESSDEKDFEKPIRSSTRRSKKDQFKVPNPIIPKPVLEIATPKPIRSVPKIIITQPSDEIATPKQDKTKTEYFTPSETPDQFFTPMTSVKTYSKISLRQNVVKKLEQEFSTPNAQLNNENSVGTLNDTRKSRPKKDKHTLVRATSPGKLSKEKRENTTVFNKQRRLRQHVKYSLDEDDKK